jgi:hypothetical protein
MFHRQKTEVDIHHMVRFAEQRRYLIEQSRADAHKLVFRGLAKPGEAELFSGGEPRKFAATIRTGRRAQAIFSERKRIQPPNRQCSGHFERGRAAHPRAHGYAPGNGAGESAEVCFAAVKLIQNPFYIIGPGGGRVLFEFVYGKSFATGKGIGNQLNLPVVSWRRGEVDIAIHGDRHHQAFVVIGVIAKQFEAARRADFAGGGLAELLFEKILCLSH